MAEKARPKIKAAEGFAVVSDWSEHPDVKKAIASGNVSAIEAATKKARDEGRNAFKPKDRAIPISELKEAYEASRAQEAAQEAARQEKLESARTYGRRQQQAEIAKSQRRAREKRTTGKYDATPTGGYGQPLEEFWVGEAPPMPAPTPPVPAPQVPAFPSNAPQSASIAEKITSPEALDFYRKVQYSIAPYLNTNLMGVTSEGRRYNTPIGHAPIEVNYGGYPSSYLYGYDYPFTERELTGTPTRSSDYIELGPYTSFRGLPVFPYYLTGI